MKLINMEGILLTWVLNRISNNDSVDIKDDDVRDNLALYVHNRLTNKQSVKLCWYCSNIVNESDGCCLDTDSNIFLCEECRDRYENKYMNITIKT